MVFIHERDRILLRPSFVYHTCSSYNIYRPKGVFCNKIKEKMIRTKQNFTPSYMNDFSVFQFHICILFAAIVLYEFAWMLFVYVSLHVLQPSRTLLSLPRRILL